ncbi:MAG: FAD-binding oxidoreductase [Promethearchaeia archaeon]
MKLRNIVAGANASIYYRLNFKNIKRVFYPKDQNDVRDAIDYARNHGYDITPKGAGSGLSGACTGGNRERVIISTLQMNKIIDVSIDEGYVDVQPGATPDEINAILQPRNVKFWVAPSSRDVATVGGILNTDGGGNDTWVNGTMRDNTRSVRMMLYDGHQISVDQNGVEADDTYLQDKLNQKGVTIDDIASSHGTLGFITQLRVAIRPFPDEDLTGALVEYEDYDTMGRTIDEMVSRNSPIRYGESIVMAHDDVRENLSPPLQILEFPSNYADELNEITDYKALAEAELEKLKETRIKLPKKNPKDGRQLALFEGYGLHDDSLRNMSHSIDQINEVLHNHGLIPFVKYGHAPSKWYLGNNEEAYGMIMHSREIRPEAQSGKRVFQTILALLDKCKELGITPKPEHKWPFSDTEKKSRIEELRRIVGDGFNSFILQEDCATPTLRTMV